MANSGVQHHLDRGLRRASLLLSPCHNPRGRILEGAVESDSAAQFRRSAPRISGDPGPGSTSDSCCDHSTRRASCRIARHRTRSRPTGGTEAGTISSRARYHSFPGATARVAGDSRRHDRRVCDDCLKRWLRHCDRAFRQCVQEFADSGRGPGCSYSHFCCL